MRRACLAAEILDAYGESLPLASGSVDIAYSRQVLHHARDLDALVAEVARVVRSGGRFLACREHVVSDDRELADFRAAHPVHRLAGGENAFRLERYRAAIEGSGLRLDAIVGPWDSVVNAFPSVRSTADLQALPVDRLVQRFGMAGAAAARIPGVQALVRRRITRPTPGRLYSFVATKP